MRVLLSVGLHLQALRLAFLAGPHGAKRLLIAESMLGMGPGWLGPV